MKKTLPPPPVPQRLREMLADYPEYIEELQQSLNRLVAKPRHGTPMFEQAIWRLEGALESFIDVARDEFNTAEISGDTRAIERARENLGLMFRARSGNGGMRLGLMDDLWDYFENNKEFFQ